MANRHSPLESCSPIGLTTLADSLPIFLRLMEILLPIGQGTDNTAQMPKYPLAY